MAEFKIDIILLGMEAIALDKYAFVQQIRNEQPGIPLIVASEQPKETDVISCFKLGVCDYLIKPYGSSQVVAALDDAWSRRKIDREKHELLTSMELELKEKSKRYSQTEKLLTGAHDYLAQHLEKTERTNSELISSQDKYRTLIDKAPIGFMTIGPTHKISEFNPAMLKIMELNNQVPIRDTYLFSDSTLKNTSIPAKVLDCLAKREEHTVDEIVELANNRRKHIRCKIIPMGKLEVLLSIEDVTLQKQYEETLKYEARCCTTTGLINKDFFMPTLTQAVSEAQQHNSTLALLHIDIDDFKNFNTEYGHPGGTAVLQSIGRRIANSINENKDFGIRTGGDEIAIILTNFRGGSLPGIVNRLFRELSKPYRIKTDDEKKLTVDCTFSVGVCDYSGQSPNKLYEYADIATYQAKSEGKNRFCFYSEEANMPATGS